jgi:SAM-dependent MidA family methyltransferase
VTPLERLLLERIRARGPLPFAVYMEQALYHPELGFYAGARARSGWEGHYLTSPELDPAFGILWTVFLEQIWHACGEPDRFELVEIGPGEGGFAAALTEAAGGDFGASLHLVLVDPSPARRARQVRRLEPFPRARWVGSIAELETFASGCVFANEVLDNQPVHVLERRAGRVVELWVDASDRGLAPRWLAPANPALVAAAAGLAEGARMEVSPAAAALVAACVGIVGRGAVVFVDYGAERGQLAARPSGTLAAYSEGAADDDVLARPGLRDITAHVDWTSMRAALRGEGAHALGPLPQRDLLRALGLGRLDEDLARAGADAQAARRGRDVLATLSRRNALRALVDPAGLGRLEVLVGLVGIASPPALAATQRGTGQPGPSSHCSSSS